MTLPFRAVLASGSLLVALAASVVGPSAMAQPAASSAKPLHIIVPFAPGGAQDAIARTLSARLTERMRIPVVVENKAGAGGVIAADFVSKAAPDGNTVLLATGGAISIAPHLMAKLPYDARRDLVPVAMLADTPMTFAVRAQSPYKTVADVIKDAKTRPGEVTFASTGNGTVSHLTGELFAQTAGIKMIHVPYRGAGPAMTDLLGGQVATIVTSSASIEPMLGDNRARVLASFTKERMPNLRGAPTMSESGIKGLEVPVWVGIMVPAKTPAAVIEKLATELVAICKQPEAQDRFKALGAVPACGGTREFERVVEDDTMRWGAVIRQAGIKAE